MFIPVKHRNVLKIAWDCQRRHKHRTARRRRTIDQWLSWSYISHRNAMIRTNQMTFGVHLQLHFWEMQRFCWMASKKLKLYLNSFYIDYWWDHSIMWLSKYLRHQTLLILYCFNYFFVNFCCERNNTFEE